MSELVEVPLKIHPLQIEPSLKEYFNILDNEKLTLTCKLAGKDKCTRNDKNPFTYDVSRGWYNFKRHLIKTHNVPELTFEKKKAVNSVASHFSTDLKQSTDYQNVTYKRDHLKQVKFNRDLLDFIAIDGVPLDTSTKPAFVKMIKHINPLLNVISRRTIGRNSSKDVTKIKQGHILLLNKLDENSITISLDLWSSISKTSVLGIKIHFIDSNWNYRHLTVGFKHFSHKKTAHNLRLFLKTFITEELKIQPNKISAIMADNASENVKAFDLTNFHSDTTETYDDEDDLEKNCIEALADDEPENYTTSTELSDNFFENIGLAEESNEDIVNGLMNFEVIDWTSTNFVRLGCTAHALQLVLKDVFNGSQIAPNIMKCVNSLLSFFNKSNYWNQKLIEKTKLSLVAPGTTRWNTNIFALERILQDGFVDKINEVILLASNAKNKPKQIPSLITESMVCVMKDIKELPMPFVEVTNVLQADTVTSSFIILSVIQLHRAISKVEVACSDLDGFKQKILVLLVERFASPEQFNYRGRGPRKQLMQVFTKKEYILASLLDPRVKIKPFQLREKAHGSGNANLADYIPSEEDAVNFLIAELKTLPTDLNQADDPVPVKKSKRMTKSVFDEDSDDETATQSTSSTALTRLSFKDEVSLYLAEPNLSRNASPLLYWKNEGTKFPSLQKLVKRILAIPASSGGVERLFSIAGSIARSRRNRLSICNLEKLLIYRQSRIDTAMRS